MTRHQDLIQLMIEHVDAWNDHDLDRLMALFDENAVFESSGGSRVMGERYVGKAAVRQVFAGVFSSMPDAHWGDGRYHAIDDGYGVSEWTLTGTTTEGTRLEVNGCDFLTVRSGLITLKNSYRKQRPPS
jgi:steroid delta-isomerase-like uncharacterized protein